MRSPLSALAALLLPLVFLTSPAFSDSTPAPQYLVYDNGLQLLWMGNGHSTEKMTWQQANLWAEGLSYGGFSDWRLPTTYDFQASDEPLTPESLEDSELGHLYYSVLGLVENQHSDLDGAPTKKDTLFDDTTFKNLRLGYYWLGTNSATPVDESDAAWLFDFQHGTQFLTAINKNPKLGTPAWAIAVRSVPEPASALLLAAGLAGTLWSLRRKKS